jgi:hypothetical protein
VAAVNYYLPVWYNDKSFTAPPLTGKQGASFALPGVPSVLTEPAFLLTGVSSAITRIPLALTGFPLALTEIPLVLTGALFSLTVVPSVLTHMLFAITGVPFAITQFPLALTNVPLALTEIPFVLTGALFALTVVPSVLTHMLFLITDLPFLITGVSCVVTQIPSLLTSFPFTLTCMLFAVTDIPFVSTEIPCMCTPFVVSANRYPAYDNLLEGCATLLLGHAFICLCLRQERGESNLLLYSNCLQAYMCFNNPGFIAGIPLCQQFFHKKIKLDLAISETRLSLSPVQRKRKLFKRLIVRNKKVQSFENKFGTECLKLLPLQPASKTESLLKSIENQKVSQKIL